MSEVRKRSSKTNKIGSFNLKLRPLEEKINTTIMALVGVLMAGLVVAKITLLKPAPIFIKAVGFFFVFGFFSFGLFGLIYVARLLLDAGRGLELNEEGLFDRASFCGLGKVKMEAISRVEFSSMIGFRFLVFKFVSGMNPLRRRRGLQVAAYRLFFGYELWIPLYFFRLSRIDLESQLIHLDKILTRQSAKSIVPKSEAEKGAQPPSLHGPAPERSVSETVEQSTPQLEPFAVRLTAFYHEFLAHLPERHLEGGDHIPGAMSAIRGQKRGHDYEEVSFVCENLTFSFGLRRDIDEGEEALLSIGVEGKMVMSLRVAVEIADLSPIEVESQSEGEWKWVLDRLATEAARLQGGKTLTRTDFTSFQGNFDSSEENT